MWTLSELQAHAQAIFNVTRDRTEKNAANWIYSALHSDKPIENAKKVVSGPTPGCSCHICTTNLIIERDCEWMPDTFAQFRVALQSPILKEA